jgi:hypothetical protein
MRILNPTSSVIHLTNRIVHQTSSVVHPTSDVVHPTSRVVHQTNSVVHPTSSVVHPTNKVVHSTSSVVHLSLVIHLTVDFSREFDEGKKLSIKMKLISKRMFQHITEHMALGVLLMREILGMVAKIREIINEVVFPHLCFKIQIPELIGEFALRAGLILDQRTDLLQIRIEILSIKIGFRNMEPLICTNNKTQQEELQEYLNQEQTELLLTSVQDHQGLLLSTRWYSIPQTCHLIH